MIQGGRHKAIENQGAPLTLQQSLSPATHPHRGTTLTSKLSLQSQKMKQHRGTQRSKGKNSQKTPLSREEKVLTTLLEHKSFAGPRRSTDSSKF